MRHDAVSLIWTSMLVQRSRARESSEGTTLKEKGRRSGEVTVDREEARHPELKSNQDVLNFPPALDHQLIGIASAASSADTKPTDSAWTYYKEVSGQLAGILRELDGVLGKDLADFNAEVRRQEIPPVVVVPRKKIG